jgi:hypothetical protein
MRVYLDNCCFNRPFDDQSQERVSSETRAKLWVQDCVRAGLIDLVWSFMLEIENDANPFLERFVSIGEWESLAVARVESTEEISR